MFSSEFSFEHILLLRNCSWVLNWYNCLFVRPFFFCLNWFPRPQHVLIYLKGKSFDCFITGKNKTVYSIFVTSFFIALSIAKNIVFAAFVLHSQKDDLMGIFCTILFFTWQIFLGWRETRNSLQNLAEKMGKKLFSSQPEKTVDPFNINSGFLVIFYSVTWTNFDKMAPIRWDFQRLE